MRYLNFDILPADEHYEVFDRGHRLFSADTEEEAVRLINNSNLVWPVETDSQILQVC